MLSNLETTLRDASSFINLEFNLKIQKSQLKPYSLENWNKFCDINGFNKNSEGLYIPKSYSAYVSIDSPELISNTFHEYFGHGLFCEHSSIGKELVKLEHNNRDTKDYLFNEVNFQQLSICKQNIGNYEGFALWFESLLCEETDNKKIWENKKNKLPQNYNNLFESFKSFEQNLSRFALFSQLGFPKYYDDNKVIETVKKLYNSNFDNIEFVILYGSKKPYSDIDLFVVSKNESQNYFNGWLDIYELNKNEFDLLLNNLDISVTDPLFSGELIYGDKNNFENIKNKVETKEITQEAITHNEKRAKEQESYLSNFEDERKRKACLSYIESYKINAKELNRGNKILELNNILV